MSSTLTKKTSTSTSTSTENNQHQQVEQQEQLQLQKEKDQTTKHQITTLPTLGKDGFEVITDNIWHVEDLHIKDRYGRVRETISNIILYPNRHTEGDADATKIHHFHFKKGSGLIMIHGEDYMYIREIEPETHAFIDKGEWFQIVNTSKNEDMEYEGMYPGLKDRSVLINTGSGSNNTSNSMNMPPGAAAKIRQTKLK